MGGLTINLPAPSGRLRPRSTSRPRRTGARVLRATTSPSEVRAAVRGRALRWVDGSTLWPHIWRQCSRLGARRVQPCPRASLPIPGGPALAETVRLHGSRSRPLSPRNAIYRGTTSAVRADSGTREDLKILLQQQLSTSRINHLIPRHRIYFLSRSAASARLPSIRRCSARRPLRSTRHPCPACRRGPRSRRRRAAAAR
jgi:hypothetical protein